MTAHRHFIRHDAPRIPRTRRIDLGGCGFLLLCAVSAVSVCFGLAALIAWLV